MELETRMAVLEAKMESGEGWRQGVSRDLAALNERIVRLGERTEDRFAHVDERFAQVDERFRHLEQKMDERFQRMDHRFERVDARFADLQHDLGVRFTSMQNQITVQTRWLIGVAVFLAAVFKALDIFVG